MFQKGHPPYNRKSAPTEVVPVVNDEVKCSVCGQMIPLGILEAHQEVCKPKEIQDDPQNKPGLGSVEPQGQEAGGAVQEQGDSRGEAEHGSHVCGDDQSGNQAKIERPVEQAKPKLKYELTPTGPSRMLPHRIIEVNTPEEAIQAARDLALEMDVRDGVNGIKYVYPSAITKVLVEPLPRP